VLFSYIKDPRHKNLTIQFITGAERALDRRDYAVGDYIKGYHGTEVLYGEFKAKDGKWITYWIAIREGQIVGAEKDREEVNKFDVAVKYGVTLKRYIEKSKK
jgi:hypothetical protein